MVRRGGKITLTIKKIQEYIFKASQIHGDDTPVKLLEPGTSPTKTGRIWTYVRNGRPKGDEYPVAACYFYSPDRKGERPEFHLKNFTGILHADSYAGGTMDYIEVKIILILR